ncbi:mono/diheme cytochrome c family protein [Acidipila rosea]|uniref:Mono/diheme cytochrome c family protein n=1 Tax=Acidipila rosea TaxID=768535 RepID=A0A4R1L3Y0_9BACT|nr:mono/diheme cytochrome c family protein [Acidipila rosea]
MAGAIGKVQQVGVVCKMCSRLATTAGVWAAYISHFILAAFGFVLSVAAVPACAQAIHYAHPPDANNGAVIYNSGCIACHGAEGKGAPQSLTVFTRPDSFPDFTACSQTTPEVDSAYKSVIVHGGPNYGFSQIMPAFGQLLTDRQINDVVAYLRTFCHNVHHYPRGELNLPRALVTEKAFPEDELVLSAAANVSGAASNTIDAIHEQTFAGRNQLEVDVPVNHADLNGQGTSGVGDVTVGLKRELFSSLHTGSILSLQGGILLPTGDSRSGFGAGAATFEPFAAFDQLFKTNTWIQFQIGGDLPTNRKNTPNSLFYRTALGQTFARDHGLGRQYSPMVELLARRDFTTGAVTDWDILPQMQVTLSPRQHVRADIGVRAPFTDTQGRKPQIVFYVLWDWADGKFWEGW